MGGFTAKGDELRILIAKDRCETTMPCGDSFQLHPELQQALGAFRLIVNSCELVMEFDDVFLQLLADFALSSE
jgi:hypothetical protein